MIFDPAVLMALLLLGGVVALDGAGCGQFMISRPFAAATLGGLIVGEPAAGAAVGLLMEAFHLTVLPVGASRYPDGGPPALVTGAMVGAAAPGAAALFTGVVFFLGWSWLAGESVRAMRRLTEPLPARAVPPHAVRIRHLRSLGVDYVRGVILVAGGIVVLWLMMEAANAAWGVGQHVPDLVLEAAVAGLLASTLRILGGSVVAFGLGAAAALALVWVGG